MSELINKNGNYLSLHRTLLTGASVLALTAYISSADIARAKDSDRPQVWIELGGQLSELQDSQETFAPPVMDGRPSIFEPSQKFEKSPKSSIDEYGELSFQPLNSDWVFSASIQFGRSKSSRHQQQQTNPSPISYDQRPGHIYIANPQAQQFAETIASTREQHVIVDFQIGKDVGLGLFRNPDSLSSVGFGVRFAQFTSTSNFSLKSNPDWHFHPKYFSFPPYVQTGEVMQSAFHSNLATMIAKRSFHGIGPSVSWKSSVPVAGNLEDGEIIADWGIKGALLFGRQRAQTHHQSTARYAPLPKYHVGHDALATTASFPHGPSIREHNVTVPNIGGSIGLSWRIQNFKMSAGYRADLFFHAMDGGIDARKSENVGFYGPFATVSIGLGG